MAAYAAVVSLMTTVTVEQVRPHTWDTFRHSSTATKLMESLYERASFLQEFLEGDWKGATDLEARILHAAQRAEDAIELYIVNLDLDEVFHLLQATLGMTSSWEDFLRCMRYKREAVNRMAYAAEEESNTVNQHLHLEGEKRSILIMNILAGFLQMLWKKEDAFDRNVDSAIKSDILIQDLEALLLMPTSTEFFDTQATDLRNIAKAINRIPCATQQYNMVNQDPEALLRMPNSSTGFLKTMPKIAEAIYRIAGEITRYSTVNEDFGSLSQMSTNGFIRAELIYRVTDVAHLLEDQTTLSNDFLNNMRKKAEAIINRIADAAQGTNGSNMWDCILSGIKGSDLLHQDLQKAIEEMDSIKAEAMRVKETPTSQRQLPRSSISTASSRAPPFANKMLGFEDEKRQIMEELVRPDSSFKVISIVGMGGAGKTTLAKIVYDDKYIVHYFDICAWVTVSQEYDVGEILREVLMGLGIQGMGISENLEERVHKSLSGRRYLIVLDDIWSIACWNSIRCFFPNNDIGSRIVVTTRLSNLANQISTWSLNMKFLNEDNSWALFCENVFAEESCPPELEKIGRKIVQNCKGLPLALVVIGGLLRKSCMTFEYWKQVAEDVSTISLDGDDLCLEILSSSYNHLPVYLKPCFLYMSVFPEDHEIRAFELYGLWISEGFLKPIEGKSLEEIAESFLKDLLERNLILVDKWGSRGNIKSCKVHDLLRDLSIREALKEKFFCVIGDHNVDVPSVIRGQRRLVFTQNVLKRTKFPQLKHSLQLAQLTRSLVCNGTVRARQAVSLLFPRVLSMVDKYFSDPILEEGAHPMEDAQSLVSTTTSQFKLRMVDMNLRYLAYRVDLMSIHYPRCQFRNIQTLVVRGRPKRSTNEIIQQFWGMQHLRHVKFDTIVLPDDGAFPQSDQKDCIVLENLQTLQKVEKFQCTREVIKKIPNIRKLKILYRGFSEAFNYLENLVYFLKLESFALFFHGYLKDGQKELIRHAAFPHSLKKLNLHGIELPWEDMTMISSLPHLEVLKLRSRSFIGRDWNPIEGEFLCLKFLHVERCNDLVNWNANRSHFPCLEQLVLVDLIKLKEIPLDFGEIPTLRLIQLQYCGDSVVESAKNILEKQESLGNDGLQVYCNKDELKSLASENFQVHIPTRETT